MMHDMVMFQEFEIFLDFQNGLNFEYFAKIAPKIAKSKYFSVLKLTDGFSFRRCIICWGNFSKIIGGGGGERTTVFFYSAKLCTPV